MQKNPNRCGIGAKTQSSVGKKRNGAFATAFKSFKM